MMLLYAQKWRRVWRFILLALYFQITTFNCITIPAERDIQYANRHFNLPAKIHKDLALIYMIRPAKFLGVFINFPVFLDDISNDNKMGSLNTEEYIFFYTTPGSHEIKIPSENQASIRFNAKAGETYFFRIEAQMGLLFAQCDIIPISKEISTYYIMNYEKGEINRALMY